MKVKNNKKGITLLWDIHQRKASKTAALSTREVSPVHLYNIHIYVKIVVAQGGGGSIEKAL